MKILQFTIPVPLNKSIITQAELLPHFYPHLHRHHEIQVTWVQQGEGTLIAENNMTAFKGGEIYWLGANQPHLFKSDASYFLPTSKKKVKAQTLFFDPAKTMAPLFALPELKKLRSFIENHQAGFKVPERRRNEVSAKINEVSSCSGTEQLISFLQLLGIFSRCRDLEPLSTGIINRPVSESEGLKIGAVFNYIIEHADRTITLEEVAAEANMTPQAFCRYFKKHTRHTFITFLNQVRINNACRKLTDGKYENIAAIAYETGFNSVTSFNRVFRSITRFSPSAYRSTYFQNTIEKDRTDSAH